jgi:hypothetical protein
MHVGVVRYKRTFLIPQFRGGDLNLRPQKSKANIVTTRPPQSINQFGITNLF